VAFRMIHAPSGQPIRNVNGGAQEERAGQRPREGQGGRAQTKRQASKKGSAPSGGISRPIRFAPLSPLIPPETTRVPAEASAGGTMRSLFNRRQHRRVHRNNLLHHLAALRLPCAPLACTRLLPGQANPLEGDGAIARSLTASPPPSVSAETTHQTRGSDCSRGSNAKRMVSVATDYSVFGSGSIAAIASRNASALSNSDANRSQ
jgi:hypothetical protein